MAGMTCLYNLTSSNFFQSLLSPPPVSSRTLTNREWGWAEGEHWALIPAVTVVGPLHVP